MANTRWILALVTLNTVLVTAGQRASDHGNGTAGRPTYWTELMESMSRMHATMSSVEPSADVDADFVALMLPHHQAAIDMAKIELLAGKDQQMRRLAQEIIADQQSEIQLMGLWRQQRKEQ